MTCIVAAVDKSAGFSIMGGDRCSTEDSGLVTTYSTPKITRYGNSVWGFAGFCAAEQLMEPLFQEPDAKDPLKWFKQEFSKKAHKALKDRGWYWNPLECDIDHKFGIYIMVLFQQEIYIIEESLEAHAVGMEYYAIGSGQLLALGAYHACRSAGIDVVRSSEYALMAAAEYDPNVQAPFDFETLNENNL